MAGLNFSCSYNPIPPKRMKRPLILTGRIFDQLTVIALFGRTNAQKLLWLCQCRCGGFTVRPSIKLFTGKAHTCGHTLDRNSSEYLAYRNARDRCTIKTNKAYARYGGRGIQFRFDSYEQFLATIGRKPGPGYSLERKDNNGHYEPGNIVWATMKSQARNRRNTSSIAIDGKTKSIAEWAENGVVDRTTVRQRLARNWCARCAVFNLPYHTCCKLRKPPD